MNPGEPSSVVAPPLTTDVTTALRDRVLTMGTNLPPAILGEVDPVHGGVVITGAKAYKTAATLRVSHPSLPILIEPAAASNAFATPEQPFIFEDHADSMLPVTLEEDVDRQRRAGADFVITPSGHVRAQDARSLKAVVSMANSLTSPDVLCLASVSDMWLTPAWVKTLCAILKNSDHPVLLGIASSSSNPLARKGAIAGYKQVAEEVGSTFAWRTDLSGLGFIAHGGLGAAIGVLPSQRRFAIPGQQAQSSDKSNNFPHILLPEMLRYSRSNIMHREWFASEYPEICVRPCCNGRAVDRFDSSDLSREVAHRHNLVALNELVDSAVSIPVDQRPSWWRRQVNSAIAEHTRLGARISRPIDEPADLKRWQEVMA